MISWQFRQPEVLTYEPEPLIGIGDDEDHFDVTGFTTPKWVIRFQVRKVVRIFGHQVWEGTWRPMQMVAR